MGGLECWEWGRVVIYTGWSGKTLKAVRIEPPGMRVLQTEATQCKDCKVGKPGMVKSLTEAPVATLEKVRGTVGRGEVSFRRSRGTRLCGPLVTTVRNLACIGSEMGASDRFIQRTRGLIYT